MSSRAKPSPILEPGEAPSGAYGGILPGQIPREPTQQHEKGLFTFLRRPEEKIPKDNRCNTLLTTLLWFGMLSLLSVTTALLFASLHAIVPESPAQDLTTWKILCGVSLSPILEELMFRLPLKRGRYTLLPAQFLFSFYFISGIFHVERISDDRLVLRLILSLGIMAASFPPLRRIICKMDYPLFFYGAAATFGFMHFANFGPEAWAGATTLTGLLYLLWYMADKTAAGILYGYARLKHGFFMAVLIHILNNRRCFCCFYSGDPADTHQSPNRVSSGLETKFERAEPR